MNELLESNLSVVESSALACQEQPQQEPSHDLRHAMMTLPVAQQNQFLSLYKERRDNFRRWLMSQLVEGVHFGIVPGCEPKTKDFDGVLHYGVWNKKANGGKGAMEWYPPSQWTPKPSLYAAGADFICDILGVRDEYETDAVAWQQMGSKSGTAVVKCRLKSRATDELIGESLGAYSHQYDANNALKMASKCAKVGAVINAYDLRDLFTQDESPPPNVNPDQLANAPQEQPRAKREKVATEVSPDQLGHVTAHWKTTHPQADGDGAAQKQRFYAWARTVAKREFDPSKLTAWTKADYLACCEMLHIQTLEELSL